MAQIKQELKFYRIPTLNKAVDTLSGQAPVSGYLNRYEEFKQWDDYRYSVFGVGINLKSQYGPTPVDFFAGGDENGVLEGFNIPYKELTFVLDSILEPYSRENREHNLTDVSQSVYIMDYSTKEPTAIAWESRNTDLDNARRSFLSPISPNYNAVSNLESVSFYINPRNINIQQKKLWQKIRTRGGWALQHWGADLGTIQIRGTTGNIRPPIGLSLSNLFSTVALDELPNVLNSPAFAGLKKLEKWYKEDQDELRVFRKEVSALEYRGQLYVGHLTGFNYEESAEEPFQLTYSIEFAIHYDASDLQMALIRASEHYTRNKETLEYMSRIYNDYNTVEPSSTTTTAAR